MKNEHGTKQLYKGALLLTLAGLLSKVLSAGYRIPLQNIAGDYGFYIYQQIYPFLGIAMMLALYGFPTAISRVVSEQTDEGKDLSLSSFYFPLVFLLLLINGLLFVSLFIFAEHVAGWMGDPMLFQPLRVTAFVFLLIPFTSLARGVFQGLNDMKPTAISQIVEQIVRVSIILVSAVVLVKQGKDLYAIGSGAAIGSIAGAFTTFLLLLIIWLKKQPVQSTAFSFSMIHYIKTIVFYGLLISVNHMVLLLFQFADAFTVIPNLIEYGYSIEEAKVWKGIFDRGQPLIQLGTVVGSALALALVPSITKKRIETFPDLFKSHIQSAIKLSVYLSSAATVGLITIFPQANILLFQDDKGTNSLKVLALSIIFASLVITTASILQGLGHVLSTAFYILIGFLLKGLLNSYFVPIFEILGSALATVTSISIVLLLNLYKLKRVLPAKTKVFAIPWKAYMLSMGGMVLFLLLMNEWVFNLVKVTSRGDYLIYVLVVCIIGAVIYCVLLIKLNGFTNQELQAIPLGRSISGTKPKEELENE